MSMRFWSVVVLAVLVAFVAGCVPPEEDEKADRERAGRTPSPVTFDPAGGASNEE